MHGGPLPITFRPGRRPPIRTRARVKLRPHMSVTTPAPASVNWFEHIGIWPMYLNDRIGDCAIAMEAHALQATSTYGSGFTITVSDNDVLPVYERVSGYNPDDPSSDVGCILQDVYADWRRTGIAGHKALAFAEVEPSDLDEIKTAVYLLGTVGLGIDVTTQMMTDFDNGKDWTRAGGRSLGGHAVVIVGYDDTGVWIVTWGKVIKMTWSVFRHVVDEAWVAILPEWLDANGTDPLGVNLYGLGEELHALTGDPNPFPAPAPTPIPPGPAPAPGPDADPNDVELAAALKKWLAATGL